LLEDSIETLSYVNNAEVYLSLNKLAIVIQQEIPFIRTMINGDTCFFTKDSIKLNLVDSELTKVLFFIDDIRSRPWKETLYLGNYVYNNSFLDSLISKVSHNQYSEYILHSDLFDFKINIGSVNKLDEKVDRIKLFFATIATEKRLIKELNVIYDNQIICVN
jgi:cell division protein FtsQ